MRARWHRSIVPLLASLAVHVAGLLVTLLAVWLWRSPPPDSPTPPASVAMPDPPPPPDAPHTIVPPADRAALKAAVTAGELLLGEAFLTLEARQRGRPEVSTERARARYRAVLSDTKQQLSKHPPSVPRAILAVLRRHRLDLHRRLATELGAALLEGGGDCTARTRLVASLIHDLGYVNHAWARVFDNHLAPVFAAPDDDEYRFGMVAACTGDGVRVPALRLLDATLPESPDRCRDDEALLGAPLSTADPLPGWSGEAPPLDKHCPLALWPWREAGDSVGLVWKRHSGTETDSGPTRVTAPDRQGLLAYSAGVACHQRWVRSMQATGAPAHTRLPFLAKAIGYQREAALAFAAAGELPLTRAVEAAQAEMLRQARHLLAAADFGRLALQFDFWTFIYLGAPGHAAMFEMAQRDLSWFASNMIGVLIVEPATRPRALRLLHRRPLPQQFEIAERVEWDEPGSRARRLGSGPGRHVAQLRSALNSARHAWQTCSLSDLQRIARDQVARRGLPREYGPALVAFLAESPILHLDEHGCDATRFAEQVGRWRASQPAQLQPWLDRTPPAEGSAGARRR